MEIMAEKFLKEGHSFIIVCNDNMTDRVYFENFIEAFAKYCGLPPTAFGGYKKKLDHGVMVCYILQPEWVDMIEHMKKEKNGEDVEDVSTDWKKQDHITREIDEAIKGLYKISVPIEDIKAMVGVGQERVTKWIDAHPECELSLIHI